MASLITRLYMKEHKIISPQSIDCRFCLAFIIGIRKPCSTINIDNFQSGILSNTGAPDKPCGVGRADANPKTMLPNDT